MNINKQYKAYTDLIPLKKNHTITNMNYVYIDIVSTITDPVNVHC